jgi:hypothetical protein
MGIYDQLSQLDQSPTPETLTVSPSDIPTSAQSPAVAQLPSLKRKLPANRPTAASSHSVPTEAPASSRMDPRDKPREVPRDLLRRKSRELPRNMVQGKPREFPTREEIQAFSFHLRDSLKTKVQAEVPHEWQDELEEVARLLDVKKLELYRFIIGEFLGKVERQSNA